MPANADAASSNVASSLTVCVVHATGTYAASGNAVQILGFFGPNYGVSLGGSVTTTGSIISRAFSINGGGNGGMHYDESLGRSGPVSGWAVASYFDDARTDL